MKPKKFLAVIILGSLFLFCASHQAVLAAERVVQLTVPGSAWPGTAARVRSILQSVDGVLGVETDYKAHTATVTFNDEKTNIEEMKKALERGNFSVEGEPQFLK